MLGVAKDRQQQPTQSPSMPTQAPPPRSDSRGGFSFDDSEPTAKPQPPDPNEQAVVLIRAMVNAAKSDGRITPEEQDAVMKRMQNPSQDAIDFLRKEFSRPLDAREFAWSVPLGMEEKVYTMSLAAIDLDAPQESEYLRELAHGLRLEPETCNEINLRYGAPALY